MDKSDLHCLALMHTLAGAGTLLPDALPDDLLDHVQVQRLSKGQLVFDEGQPVPWLYVVRQGCFKLLCRSEAGDEWVLDFVAEGDFLCSVTALLPGGRSSCACEALEDGEVERVDYAWLERTAHTHPQWQQVLLQGWKAHAIRREWRERDLLTLGATRRYEAFLHSQPDLARRVPQKDLARYLGITPVSLSRIRGRLTREAAQRAATSP
jgi:CRP-like cAMP-binding protein